MKLDESVGDLHRGTTATIRASSLAGIANRYVSLQLGPDKAVGAISQRRDDLSSLVSNANTAAGGSGTRTSRSGVLWTRCPEHAA